MSEKAVIRIHDDKHGKTHIDFYSDDPRKDHDSIHIDIPNDGTGRANITEKFNGEKSSSNIWLGKK